MKVGARILVTAALAAALAAGAAGLGVRAQPASRDTGYATYRQFCGGCHDNPTWNPMTLPKIRTIGEPRVRRSLLDQGEEAIHYYGDRIPKERMEQLFVYLSPEADKSLDCGPRGANLSPTPQCPDTGVPIGPPEPANRPIPDR